MGQKSESGSDARIHISTRKQNWGKCEEKRTGEYAFLFKCHFVSDIYMLGAPALGARNRKVNFINANGDIRYAEKKEYC